MDVDCRHRAVPLAVLVVLDFALDEPMRRQMERRLNDRLRGYTVQIRALDFHVLGFSLDLKDAVIVQQANPDPPVARIPKLSASVQWRELLTGYVVADFLFDNPVVYVNRQHFKAEVQDEVPIEQRGWQDALQAVYPFKINQFTVVNGELIYVDEGPFRPLQLTRVNFRAENIRNIRSRHRTYPSELYLEAMVFDAGRLRLDGRADFLAEPHPGIRAGVDLEQMELDYFKPIARRYNLEVSKGTLSADGVLEYAPDIKVVHLREVSLHGLHGDFVHSRPTAAAEKQVRKEIGRAAEKVSNAPSILLRVDHAKVANSTVGFVNRAANPEYRIFLADAQLDVTNLSNQFTEGTAVATLKGRFMGSGATAMKATFRPDTHGPDFDLDLRVDDTQMRAMNDLLRAYGKFDVVAGLFSFYSELAIKNGTIEGYVKPMFRDLDVYDERQDREKSAFRKLYEGLVGGISKLLENRARDEVATKASVSGRVEQAKANTLEVIVGLIQNAFFKAILPGFDREIRRTRG